MKANELEIGDIVTAHGKPIHVCGVFDNRVYGENGCDVRETAVHAVPLTKEILQANGAKFQQPKYLLLGGFSMWLSEKEGCYVTRMGAAGVADNWVYFRHVHELQHALRLCGLNELADNFKIE